MVLTDTNCRNAKATEKPQKLSDSGELHLFISPSGGRLRRMAATRLNEMGQWSADAIERQLAHQDANATHASISAEP